MTVSRMEICQMKNSSVNYFHFVEMRVKVLVKDLREVIAKKFLQFLFFCNVLFLKVVL